MEAVATAPDLVTEPLSPDAAAAAGEEGVTGAVLRLPFSFARRHGVMLLPFDGDADASRLEAAHRAGVSPLALAEARRVAGTALAWREVTDAEFETLLERTYARDSSQARQMVEDLGEEFDLASLAESVPETADLLDQEDDAPIIRLINAILAEAIKEDASDIHVETFDRELVVRFRVDGVLREIVRPKRALAPLLVSRIKVMARLDIAEKRVPQDGRITLRIGGREVDVRVSTLPTANGERVVLRLLDKQAGRLDLGHLGMPPRALELMREIVSKPHGIVLVTGPTGSGKTTTLYASLGEVRSDTLNVMTVEDPIEYNLPGIGQTQVNTKAGMTFARGLRAILRQDPDVVMVGEIRDLETAEIAIQAALTGHLVMSTLHTNTAIGAVTRLQDIGIEPYLLSSSMVAMLAQRLVRVLCTQCRTAAPATAPECAALGLDASDPPTLYHPVGCEHCNGSGYRGRTGIYELIHIDETLREMIHRGASELEMERHAHARTDSLLADGRHKVLEGITSVNELLRVTRED
jgi:general secretion pathway protein E